MTWPSEVDDEGRWGLLSYLTNSFDKWANWENEVEELHALVSIEEDRVKL